MKIVVLEGSPNKKGSTHLLADCFRQGAEEAGHIVEPIDVVYDNIHPCTGCIHCSYEGPCAQKDDVEGIRGKILSADMMVFATPLYSREQRAKRTCLHVHLATAARVKYPAALLRCKFDAP